jgi:hypothetical protein
MPFDVFRDVQRLVRHPGRGSGKNVADLSLAKGSMLLLSHEEQQQIVPRVYTDIVNTEAAAAARTR